MPLRSFLGRPRAERRLVFRALILLARIRLRLGREAPRSLRERLASARRDLRGRDDPARGSISAERVAWAVSLAARFVPRATCLAQAVAAHVLLERYGYHADLRLGVAREPDGSFGAHAWVEHDGRVLIGAEERERFTALHGA